MKMRTFYKQLPLFIKKNQFCILIKNSIFGKNRDPCMWGVQSNAMWCLVFVQPFQTWGTHSETQNGQKVNFTAIMDPKSQFLVPHFRPIFFSLQNMGMWGVQSDAMWYPVFLQPFQTQGNPLRGSKRPKNQFYGHFGPKIPIFRLFWAAEWVPWVCHVMFGPYATFSNPTDSISGSECLYFERKKVTKNLDVGSKMAVKLIFCRNFSNT